MKNYVYITRNNDYIHGLQSVQNPPDECDAYKLLG